jgi:hypothetical protein
VALFKTDYEEGRLQLTTAGHPQLATHSWPPTAGHPKGELLSTGCINVMLSICFAFSRLLLFSTCAKSVRWLCRRGGARRRRRLWSGGGRPSRASRAAAGSASSRACFGACLATPRSRNCICKSFVVGGSVLHGCMARGGHGLPKVSLGPAIPYASTPFGRATPETTLQLFQGWPACRAGGLTPPSTPLDTSRRTPLCRFAWSRCRRRFCPDVAVCSMRPVASADSKVPVKAERATLKERKTVGTMDELSAI